MENELMKRYDFILLFDVKDGNPNGDPDAGNLPRIDTETGHGLVTDVCLKRKIRNYVEISKGNAPGYGMFVREKAILGDAIKEAYIAIGVDLENRKEKKGEGEEVDKAREFMCKNYYDIRTFGGVLSIGANAGQVRGPVQLTFGRSIDPVVTSEHTITRMAVATPEEAEKQRGDNRTMGRKFTVPYGLYKAFGFVSVPFAKRTGFNNEDLDILWDSLRNMFEHDRSAARGLMGTRKLIIFEHSKELGDCPVQELFDAVRITKNNEEAPSRDFSDYKVSIDKGVIPESVKIIEY